jgi:hypothetical protein
MDDRFLIGRVRYVVATDIYHLETKVNAVLASNDGWYLHGTPQVFGHEQFVQAFTNMQGQK